MDHTSDWRQAHELIVDEIVDRVGVCNIAATDQNVGAEERHFVDQILNLACCRATSGDENDVHGALTDHPFSHASTETASSTNENVDGILVE